MFKVAYATGSRADYGIVRKYLKLLDKDNEIDLKILVTGALLDKRYGHQVDLITEDGFEIGFEADIDLDPSSTGKILHSMSLCLDAFAAHFESVRYDLLIILGDRYEMLPVAISASMLRIPILHIHGGEATYANYDEFIRHSITKMSLFHFTSTEEYRKRVIQLGEAPDRVFYLGALGAENCMEICEENVPEEIKKLQKKKYFVVLFHPETLSEDSEEKQMNNLLGAISENNDYQYVFIGSNADTNSNIIRQRIHEHIIRNKNAVYFENLHSDAYHYLVKNSICLIGNSSSGIIEAPSLGVFTINIGHRQDGRVRGNSVIDVPCAEENISIQIKKLANKQVHPKFDNPYYLKDTAERYFTITKDILEKLPKYHSAKKFYNL